MDYFAKVAQESPNRPKRSGYDLSHSVKQSQSLGKICPSMVLDVVPGDDFDIRNAIVARTNAMITPLLHHVDIRTDYFYVPYRILSDNFEEFLKDPKSNLVLPNINLSAFITLLQQNYDYSGYGSLADYLGLPMSRIDTLAFQGDDVSDFQVSLFPFMAYQLIYHEWYQYKKMQEYDQFIEDFVKPMRQITTLQYDSSTSMTQFLGDLLKLRNHVWSRDYFTECTREPQQGDPVQFPFDGQAPVNNGVADFGDPDAVVNTLIRDLRCAIDIQYFLEKQNAAGYDYREVVLQHFGVWNSDGRLLKPEYIGSTRQNMIHSDVTVTADTDNAVPGEMAGKGFSSSDPNFVCKNYRVTEHGLILGLTTILPQSGYFQGVSRLWTRQKPLDFFWPEFQNLGDQPVFEKEIYLCGDNQPVSNDAIFGYNTRFSEFKQIPDRSAGYFNSYLNTWHLNRHFQSPPTLSHKFEEVRPEADNLNRNFAVLTDNAKVNAHNFYLDIYHQVNAVRPMQYADMPHVVKL